MKRLHMNGIVIGEGIEIKDDGANHEETLRVARMTAPTDHVE